MDDTDVETNDTRATPLATSSDVARLPDSLLQMNRSGPTPLYYQLSRRIEEAIRSGQLPPGSRLETEAVLSDRLALSRPTVRRAIQELVGKGLLVRRRGIGTQVVQGALTREVELTSLWDDMLRTGRTPSTRLLTSEVLPADDLAAAQLGVALGSPVLHLRRLRFADGVPVAVLENSLPEVFTDLSTDDLADQGLYQVLRARGVTMRVARQTIGARRATPTEARLLNVDRNGPLLTMDRTAYDAAGRAAEFGRHAYRPDLYSFRMTLVDR